MKLASILDRPLKKGDLILRRKKSGEPFVDKVIWASQPVKNFRGIYTIELGSELFPLSTFNFCNDLQLLIK